MPLSFSEVFVLNELGAALGCDVEHKNAIPERLTRSGGVYELARWGGLLKFTRGVEFSLQEKKFINTVLGSYSSLRKQLNTRGVAHQYIQTAITSSVFDIAVSRFVARSRGHFLSIHMLIQYLKRLSYEKYEGEQVGLGFFVTKSSQVKAKRGRVKKTKYELVEVESKIRIDQSLLADSSFLRYVNGVDSFYVCDTNLDILGFLNFVSCNYDSFSAISGRCVEDFVEDDGGVYFYVGVTSKSDVELFVDGTYRLLFRKGRWYFVDCPTIDQALAGGATGINPWRIFYSMSKIKKGTVSLVSNASKEDIDKLTVRHTSSDDGMRRSIMSCVVGSGVGRLCDTGELMRILTTDGMTIFNNKFDSVDDFNVIVNTAVANNAVGGGGRTSAAIAGSQYGVAIKVSEDGPMSIYKDEELIYKIG